MKIEKIEGLIRRLLLIAALAVYVAYSHSCANTTQGPTGGPKDTIPPVIVKTIPDSIRTNVPLTNQKIYITFDEYVQLKNPSTQIMLSPPSKKRPTAKIKKKSIVVTFEDTLRSDITYALNFGEAISDVNESNPFNNYVYIFSTGKKIDSMIVSGTVMDYETLLPVKGALVSLYREPKDSSVVKELPIAVTKSDDWGYFCIRALKGVPYMVYAFEDKNNNFLYDKGLENAGFCDTAVTPSLVEKEGMKEIAMMDMKDTLACLSRPSQIDIYTFKERADKQFLTNWGRISERECFLKFNAAGVQIDTFRIKGIYDDKIIKQFNSEGDSLTFWIDERKALEDTLLLRLNYMKTDSTGNLVPNGQTLKLAKPFDKSKIKGTRGQTTTGSGITNSYVEALNNANTNRSGGTNRFRPNNQGNQNEDSNREKTEEKENQAPKEREDLLKFNLSVDGKTVENMGIELTFPTPLIKTRFDSLIFTTTTPRGVKSDVKFKAERDSSNVLRYMIYALDGYKVGNEYNINIPQGIFQDINGFTNDSLKKNFSLPTDDKLSSVTLEIKNSGGNRYIIELLTERRDRVILRHIVSEDKEIKFPYLSAGTYSFRITEDKNGNGKLDIGNILKRIPPEKARFFKLPNGNYIIEIKEQTDLTQTVDIQKLFN